MKSKNIFVHSGTPVVIHVIKDESLPANKEEWSYQVQPFARTVHVDGLGNVHVYGTPVVLDTHGHQLVNSQAVNDMEAGFKNFHKNLCDLVGYTHDPVDWKRDQVSLIEFLRGKLKTTPPRSSNIAFLVLDAFVTSWDGCLVNGAIADVGKVPLSADLKWRIMVHPDTGAVADWPKGVTASIRCRVHPSSSVTISDAANNAPLRWAAKGLPPGMFCPQLMGPATGEYIVMDIDAKGFITNWIPPCIDLDQWELV